MANGRMQRSKRWRPSHKRNRKKCREEKINRISQHKSKEGDGFKEKPVY